MRFSALAGRCLALGSLFLGLCAAAVAQAPTIDGFAPSTVGIGQPVVITGTNFSGNGNVTVRFNGIAGTSTVINSPTQVTSVVPGNVITSGNLTLTTSLGGTAAAPTPFTLNLAPVINSFSPTTAPANRMVTLSGYNFLGTAITNRTVSINGINATGLLVTSNTIAFPIPANATSGPIRLVTNHGQAFTVGNLTIQPGAPPANDAFETPTLLSGASGSVLSENTNATKQPGEPNHGTPGGASVWYQWTAPETRWYIFNPAANLQSSFGSGIGIYTGDDFGALMQVASGAANSTAPRYSSAAVFLANAGTTYRIAVDGFNGVMGDFRLTWSEITPPAVSSVSPSSGFAGQWGTVTITGNSFGPISNVTIGGAPVPLNRTTVNSANSITVSMVPLNATIGSAPIVITSQAGSGSSGQNFTVTPTPAPNVTSFSPTQGVVNTNVTFTGTGLAAGDAPPVQISFNGTPAQSFTISNSTSISARVPAGATTGPITIATAGGTFTTSTFTVANGPAPIINGFSPGSGIAGSPVVISGENFVSVTRVSFNGANTTYTVDSPTQVTAVVPPNATTGPISLAAAGGTAFSSGNFTVLPSTYPTITSISPSVVTPGLRVTLTGMNFTNVLQVMFGGIVASNVTVDSPTQITVTTPAGVSDGQIAVFTDQGVAVSPPYTVTLGPIITGFTPGSGPNGRIVVAQGFNFSGTNVGNATVRVNGVGISALSRSATTLTFPVPANATTGPITVQTLLGNATSSTNFIVEAGPAPDNDHFANATVLPPTIAGVINGNIANATKEPGEPNHAGVAGGASVWFRWTAPSSGLFLFNPYNSGSSHFGIVQTIYTGSDVASLTPVASGLTPASAFARYGSAAVLDAVAGTTYSIALDGFNGFLPDYRLAWNPLLPPAVNAFTPSSGTAGQPISLSITGSNFTPGSQVYIGGVQVEPSRLGFSSQTLITVSQLPANAVSGPITVVTSAGTATSSQTFTVALLAPTIASVSPSGSSVGWPVTITGSNFNSVSSVQFNGTPSVFSVTGNNTIINTTVPAGASTGPITVTTPGGQATSSTPYVVILPPVIVQQPQSQTVSIGGNVTFSIVASSNGPEEYQWRKDGAVIIGNSSADTRTLVLSNLTVSAAGSYTCTVYNNAGSATSDPAILTVTKLPGTVTLAGLSAVYDGSPKLATATTSPEGLAVEITYANGLTPANAGSYAVTARIVDSVYTGETTGTLTIAPAPVAIQLGALTQTYDGTAKSATVTTVPAAVPVVVTYNGSAVIPVNAGVYTVAATSASPNYAGSAGGTLTIRPAAATITLAGLQQRYDGTPRVVTVTTVPANLPVLVLYNGAFIEPVLPGTYAVTVQVTDNNYLTAAEATLVVSTTALVRHAPVLNGDIDGSAQVLLPENVTLNSGALISGDLLVPGTPTVRLNGMPTYGSIFDVHGSATPTDHIITLNSGSVLGRLARRVDVIALPTVTAPAAPLGTRNVAINSAGQSPGDFATLRNLTLNGNVGAYAIPPGIYGNFTLNGSSRLILGSADATQPAVYELQQLTLNGSSSVQIAGPVVLRLANPLTLNGSIGTPETAGWLSVEIANGGVTLNSNTVLAGRVLAPNGRITVNSARIVGSTASDNLTLNGSGVIEDPHE